MANYLNRNGTNGKDELTFDSHASSSVIYHAEGGNDTIKLSGGSVIIYTDQGSNTIDVVGGLNHTIMVAATAEESNLINGADILTIDGGDAVEANLGSGKDVITIKNSNGRKVNGTSSAIRGGDWGDTFTTYDGALNYQLYGDNGDDIFYINGGRNINYWGGAANDTYEVKGGTNNKLWGGDSADIFNIYVANQNMVLGYGQDTVNIYAGDAQQIKANWGINTINLTAGNGHVITSEDGTGQDTVKISGSVSNVTANLGDGSDTIYLNAGSGHTIFTEGWGDKIEVGGTTSDSLVDAGDGNDAITVEAGNNITVLGGEGNDVITLNGGSNITVKGGTGNDTYVISLAKSDLNFKIDQSDASASDNDVLQLSDYASEDFSYRISDSGNLILVHKDGGSLEVQNWNNSRLIAAFSDCTSNMSMDINKSGSYVLGPTTNKVYFSGSHLDVNLNITKGLPLEFDFSAYDNIDLRYRYSTDVHTGELVLELMRVTSATSAYVYATLRLNMRNLEGPLSFVLGGEKYTIAYDENASVYYDANTNGYITIDSNNSLYTDNFVVYGNGGENRIKATGVSGGAIYGGLDVDTINIDNGAANLKVYGGEDDDVFTLGYNSGINNSVYGEAGDDNFTLTGGKGAKLYGGAGNDYFKISSSSIDNDYYIDGGSGHNTFELYGGKGGTVEAGDDGNEIKLLGSSNLQIFLGSGDDVITYKAGTNNSVAGGAGNDSYIMDNLDTANVYIINQKTASANDIDRVLLSSYAPSDFSYEVDEAGTLEVTNSKGAKVRILGWSDNDTLDFCFSNNEVSHKAIQISSSGTYTIGATTQKFIFNGLWDVILEGKSYLPVSLDFTAYNTKEYFIEYTIDAAEKVLCLQLFNGTAAENAVRIGLLSMDMTYQKDISLLWGDACHIIPWDGNQRIEYGSFLKNDYLIDGSIEKYKSNFVVYGNGNDDSFTIINGAKGAVYGDYGNDVISVDGAGDGIIIGAGSGNDEINVAKAGNDYTIDAGAGDDIINVVDAGNNYTIDAGTGDDIITIAGGSRHNIIDLGGNNEITLSGVSFSHLTVGCGLQNIIISACNDITAELGAGDNTINIAMGNRNNFSVNGGENSLTAKNSISLIYSATGGTNLLDLENCAYAELSTGNGNDVINLDNSNYSVVNSGAGDDSITINNSYGIQVKSGEGKDVVILNNCSGGSLSSLGLGENNITLNGGSEMSVNLGAENDIINIIDGLNHDIYGNSGDDNFCINGSGKNITIYGDGGNDYIKITSLNAEDSYIINQGTAEDGDIDVLDLSVFNSDEFYIKASATGYVLSHKDGGTITVKNSNVQELDKIIFANESVDKKLLIEKLPKNTVSALEVMRKFMASLDVTTKFGSNAVDEAIAACSLGKYNNFLDVYEEFKTSIKTYSGPSYAEEKAYLEKYCGIIMDNSDTGAITGADAGGPIVKNNSTVVAEPTGMTINDFTIDYDTLGRANVFDYTGYIRGGSYISTQRECYTKNVNGVTFYWNEDGWTDAVNKSVLEQVAGGVLNAWAPAAFNLIEESYGLSLTDENSVLSAIPGEKAIQLILDYNGGNGTLASVWSFSGWGSSGVTTTNNEALVINMYYYSKGVYDVDGNGNNWTSLCLDRLIGHELTHAVMSANINSFGYLPKYLKEGCAELTIGIDDFRYSDILSAVNPNYKNIFVSTGKVYDFDDKMDSIFELVNNGFTDVIGPYAAGYTFWRYLSKQVSEYSAALGINYEPNILVSDFIAGIEDNSNGVSNDVKQTQDAILNFSDIDSVGEIQRVSVCDLKLDENGQVYISSNSYDI